LLAFPIIFPIFSFHQPFPPSSSLILIPEIIQAGDPQEVTGHDERQCHREAALRHPQSEMSERRKPLPCPLSNHLTPPNIFQKQIDWNKVASDPVLQQEITNGHAARMRYSRFKKQIEGTAAPRKPRNPNSPRKTKVEKNKSPKKEKVKKRSDSDGREDAEKIKEEVGVAGSSHHTPVASTPEAGPSQPDSFHHSGVEGSPFVKREHGSSNSSRYASTPLEEAQTPGSSFKGGAGHMSHRDEMMNSFGTSFGENLYPPMIGHEQYGMGMHMGMADSFPGFWDPQQQVQAEGGVLVKREPRWEQTYRQV
jgi:hypothetical protein